MALGKTNAGGGGGTGGTLVVTAPVGVTVTATNSTLGKTYTRVTNYEGKATFKGLASGTWAINMTDGSQTTNPVQVVVNSDYTIELSFFSATINVTYPAGSTCTATDGVTTLTAPDATGTWAINVPNAGTWTVTATDGDKSKSADVVITEEGQSASVSVNYELVLFDNGDNTAVTGGWTKKVSVSDNLREFNVAESISIHMDQYAGGTNMPEAYYLVCYAKTKQTLDDYATLKVTLDKATSDGYIAVNSSIPTFDNVSFSYDYIELFAASKSYSTSSSAKTVELDISSFTGSYYVVVIVDGASFSADPTQITKVWLE